MGNGLTRSREYQQLQDQGTQVGRGLQGHGIYVIILDENEDPMLNYIPLIADGDNLTVGKLIALLKSG